MHRQARRRRGARARRSRQARRRSADAAGIDLRPCLRPRSGTGAHRRASPAAHFGDGGGERGTPRFRLRVAQQCFINEYVFAQTPDERAEVERLAAAIAERIRAGTDVPAHWLAACAAYAPLWKVEGAERLTERGWPPPVDDLLAQQIREPAEERAIRPTLPVLTALDEGSLVVQAQYEENPYPRWVTPPPLIKPLSVNDFVRGKFPRAPFRPLATPDGPDVLIAGCGSGSHAIEAHRRYAGARILAVDLSRTALAYAMRKTRALGLAIEYGQADILKLGTLDRRFDVIEAAGSLQCLVDPAAGWRVLLSLLKPGGVMLLGLYSEIARADINAARAFIAARNCGGSAEEIRRCREEIAAFPPGTPGRSVLNSGDFYATSDCRDLLFHVQEYQHTIPEIAAFIAAENLTFLGFHLDVRTLRAYAARFPDDATMTDLAHWDAFERAHPHVFAAMYQFGVQKA
jgi:SAM-dependent methyltransferase